MSDSTPLREKFVDALQRGDLEDVAARIAEGADVSGDRSYNPLLAALHGRDISRDPRLLELLSLLIRHGARLDVVSDYQESTLRVLSNIGRFDAVRLLLDAGADAGQLDWTLLMHAVALGTIEDVEREMARGALLEETDWWERTAWLIALAAGDLQKARLLFDRGANGDACGRSAKPALFYAIDSHRPEIVRWLLEIGADVDQADKWGETALMHAAESADVACLDVLLAAGADIDRDVHGTALNRARDRDVVLRLLAAGANPASLSDEGGRAVLGLPPDADARLMTASAEEFRRASTRRAGTGNPERADEPFWIAMIRSGLTAYAAGELFGAPLKCAPGRAPIWSAHRFGQSLTFLPDGRMVQIAGEHEDYYDPDFCIYNDVFVHEADGSIAIWIYPEDVFPPTDFHTATLLDDAIYVIGSLGYQGSRGYGTTPVFRLDLGTWRMERLAVTGDGPGWIHGHRASVEGPRQIAIRDGYVAVQRGEKEVLDQNTSTYVLDVERKQWISEK